MKGKYSLADYVFQFITITAGVLIALFINGLVEWNDNRELVAQARATLTREIADNKKDLDATMTGFDRDRKSLAEGIRFADDMLKAGEDVDDGVHASLGSAGIILNRLADRRSDRRARS